MSQNYVAKELREIWICPRLDRRSKAWAGAGDRMLFCDSGNTGEITDSAICVHRMRPAATSVMEALAPIFDSNGDGELDVLEAEFASFKVLVINDDGSTEVKTLVQLNITTINLTTDAMISSGRMDR